MTKLNANLTAALVKLGIKGDAGEVVDAGEVAVMVLSDLFGVAYAETHRGRQTNTIAAQAAVDAINAMEAALKAKSQVLPKMWSETRKAEQAKIDSARRATVPSVLSAAILAECSKRHAK